MAITREKIVEIARSLPAAPRVLADLSGLLQEDNSALDEIARLVKRDATLAAHIIRVSNSVAYGGETRTGSVEEAVARVGLQEVWLIVSEATGTRLVDRALTHYGIDAADLRAQMLQTAFICEQLAEVCGVDPRSAYTAGLMRPLGLLVVDRLADQFTETQTYHPIQDADYLTWEGRVFGVSSCDVAAMVLTEWAFRQDIVEAVRDQYLLRKEDYGSILACLLNVAAGLVANDGQALLGETRHWGASHEKLAKLGLTQNVFESAANRARAKLQAFQRRLAGEMPVPGIVPKKAGVQGDGPMSLDSCNFPVKVRVLQKNDDPPVQTQPTGLITPTDFTTFMRNYQDMVYSTAVRLVGNEAQAEDISQEVFLKAYERFDTLQTSPTAGGWLKTVATNLSLNHLSRYRNRWRFFSEFRRSDAGAEADEPEVEFPAPDTFFSGVHAGERREWLESALDQLPEHQRVPLVLYHFEDMPYDIIAKRLGVSLAKVKTDILRARAALAQILARSGSSHEKFTA
jgi:RNA polymerase sigma-70 factor (ECF subfamily)